MKEQEMSKTAEAEGSKYAERVYEDGRVYVRAIRSGTYSLRDELNQQRSAPRVYKGSESPWKNGPQKWNKSLLKPKMGLMQTIQASLEELAPGGRSQNHGHQNPALLYVLNGRGYDINDGERVDWKAGDVVLVPPGTVHQHFNASDTEPARVLVIKTKPIYNFSGLNFQEFLEKAPEEAVPGWEDFEPQD